MTPPQVCRHLLVQMAAKGRQAEEVVRHHRHVGSFGVGDARPALHARSVERHERLPRREDRLRVIAVGRLTHAVVRSEDDVGPAHTPALLQAGDQPRELWIDGLDEVLDVL